MGVRPRRLQAADGMVFNEEFPATQKPHVYVVPYTYMWCRIRICCAVYVYIVPCTYM